MEVRINSATKTVILSDIPNGEYEGVWGGYGAHALVDGEVIRFETEVWIRTTALPCTVCVRDGRVTIKTD